MTKEALEGSETPEKTQTNRMKLRSNGPLLSQPSKKIVKTRMESLNGDLEMNEQRIIREFKIKRKLLMKALKLKCKQTSSISAIVESFKANEGICEASHFNPKFIDFGTSTVDKDYDFEAKVELSSPSNFNQESNSLPQSPSKNIAVAIQTQHLPQKAKKIKKAKQVVPKFTIETKNQLSKLAQKPKPKRKKRTQQEIQRLKSQITSLFVNKQLESESIAQSNSMSVTLTCSVTSKDETYFTEMTGLMQSLNYEIETYYEGKYLKSIILNQNYTNFNRGKSRQTKKEIQCIQKNNVQKKQLKGEMSKKVVQNKVTFKKKLEDINFFESPFSNQKIAICPIKLEITPETEKTESNSNSSKRKRRYQQKRRLLNDRYGLVVQNQFQISQIKNQNQKEKYECQKSQTELKINEEYDLLNRSQIYLSMLLQEDELETEDTDFDPMKAWISQFEKQEKMIIEKYPQLRKYKLHKKKTRSENNQLQDDIIEKICDKKALKIGKIKRKPIEKKFKKKFQKKFTDMSSHESSEQIYFQSSNDSQKIQKRKQKPKKKLMTLKEINIGQCDEEEFCKSFDHRSIKREKTSQLSQKSNRSQIVEDEEKVYPFYKIHNEEAEYEKSHDFYFESFSSSMDKKDIDSKVKAGKSQKFDEKNNEKSKFFAIYSSEQSEALKLSQKSHSFNKNQDKDYFYMSGDNSFNI